MQRELDVLTDIIAKTVPVKQIILFGSYARGTSQPDSDIDIYVIIPDDVKLREIDAIRLIRKAIRHVKTLPIDVLVSKENGFARRASAPTFERQVAEEGVVLYG